jgi:hypothetical protein
MDIGPVRRRLTAEPLTSPVPAEQPRIPGPELVGPEHPPVTPAHDDTSLEPSP